MKEGGRHDCVYDLELTNVSEQKWEQRRYDEVSGIVALKMIILHVGIEAKKAQLAIPETLLGKQVEQIDSDVYRNLAHDPR